ncbi:MAG: rod shape-determining protein [Deltaproteobacteria bacterium]|nr:rod shape-determining protein [Deltaproteobacteria bacterium]
MERPDEGLFSIIPRDIAIDLGTANTLIHMKGRGIVLNEPSIVALSGQDGDVVAVGRAAKEIYGKTPQHVRTIRPLKDGVVADFDATSKMINAFVRKVSRRGGLIGPIVVICVPSNITDVEKRVVIESGQEAGARRVYLIGETMAAAIGADIPIHETGAHMIVDIGGGTTEVGVIAYNATAFAESVGVAGDELNEAIVNAVRKNLNLDIGPYEAERTKIQIGSALPLGERKVTDVMGRDLISGVPKQIPVSDDMIREALSPTVDLIAKFILKCLEKLSPEISAELLKTGIVLAGGVAQLRGLDERIAKETSLKVRVADDPLTTVVRGTGRVVEDIPKYRRVCMD